VLLLAVAWLIIYQSTSTLLIGLIVIILAVAGIEATFRGRLLPFLASLVVILLIFAGIDPCSDRPQTRHRRRTDLGCTGVVVGCPT
jgi:hypothetical protein